MILSVFHVQLKELLIIIRLTPASIIIVLALFRATITSIVLGQGLVTPSRTIRLGRSETTFVVCANFAQQQGIRFGWNAGMRPNLFPDLIAGLLLDIRRGGKYGRHGQEQAGWSRWFS
jgi:acyl-coenzyme A synthetase/AMP-(fatty) acid ligase